MTTPSASPTLRRLPLELELAILRFALPAPSFAGWPERAAFLAGAALVCREWTTWAQVELVRDAVLPSVKQLDGLMRRLRGGDGTRLTVGRVRSLRLGGVRGTNWGGVDGKTRELLKCFNGVEEVWLRGLEHHSVNLKTLADARGECMRFVQATTLLADTPTLLLRSQAYAASSPPTPSSFMIPPRLFRSLASRNGEIIFSSLSVVFTVAHDTTRQKSIHSEQKVQTDMVFV